MTVTNNQTNLQWEMAGHERFRTVTRAYCQGATGIFIVYNSTNKVCTCIVQFHFVSWVYYVHSSCLHGGCYLIMQQSYIIRGHN